MLPKPDACLGCPFYGNGKGFVPPEGPENARLVFLTESAEENEEREGKPLIGRAGQQVNLACRMTKIKREKVLVLNTILCRPPKAIDIHDKDTQEAIAHCWRAHTGPILDRVRPGAVLAMGGPAMWRVTGFRAHTVTHGPRRIHMHGVEAARGSAWRASEVARGGGVPVRETVLPLPQWGGADPWVVATLHPAYIARGNFHLKPVFWSDFAKADRLSRGAPVDWEVPRLERLDLAAAGPVPKWPRLTFDIETDEADRVDLIGVGCGEDVKVYHTMPEPLRALRESDVPKIAHNMGFDVKGVGGSDAVAQPWVDTIIASHLVQPAFPKSLAQCASLYGGDGYFYWKDMCDNPRTWAVVTARLGIVTPFFPHRRELYNAFDVWWTDRVEQALEKEMRYARVTELFRETQMPLLPCLIDVEGEGMPVDRAALLDLRGRTEEELVDLVGKVSEMVAERSEMRREAVEKELSLLRYSIRGTILHSVALCEEHPEYSGDTRKTKCPGCAEIYRVAKQVRGEHSKDVTRLKSRLKRYTANSFKVSSDDDWRWLLFSPAPEGLGLKSKLKANKGKGKQSLGKNALRGLLALAGLSEEARTLLQARFRIGQLESRLGKYLSEENIDADGRIHAAYSMHITLTGRTASGFDDTDADKPNSRWKVNAQNWPKDVRRIIGTRGLDGDYRIVSADYSAIEAWMSAIRIWEMTGSRGYWDFLCNTADPHQLTADRIAALTGGFVSRYQGKRTRHMWTYRASPKMMAIVLAGDGVTFEMARAAHKALAELHPDALEWWDVQIRAARRDTVVRNPLGRLLRVTVSRAATSEGVDVDDANSLIAWWPQSTAHEISKRAWIRMREAIRRNDRPERIIGHAHDDFRLLVPAAEVEGVTAGVKRLMEWPVEWLRTPDGTPFVPHVEVAVGRNWGDYHRHGEKCEVEPFQRETAPGCTKEENLEGLREVEI